MIETQENAPLQAENEALKQRIDELEQLMRTQTEKRHESLFESGSIILFRWVAAPTWPVDFVSSNVQQLGYTPNDFTTGRIPYATIVYPDDMDRVVAEVTEYSQSGANNFEQSYRILDSDGQIHWIYDYTRILRDYEGMITHYEGYILDITKHRKVEEELLLFKSLVQNAADPIGVGFLDGTLIYANPSYFRQLLYDKDAIGSSFLDHYDEPPEKLMRLVQITIEQGSWLGELSYKRKDGTTFPGMLSSFPVIDEQGNVYAVAGTIRDMTEQKLQDEERARLQEQIIEAQRATLHELSSPLIPIADNVVIMPLIGNIDSERAQIVMESLLEGVAQHRADVAILDITGVHIVDTQVANVLIRAAQAVQLLGAEVVITGIGPAMAQTLVSLGVDLSSIITRGNLQRGIAYAISSKS